MPTMDPHSGVKVQISSKAANVAFAMTVAGTGHTRTVTFATDVAAQYRIDVWLEEAAVATGQLSRVLPDGNQQVEWMIVTTAAGTYTLTITHSGAHTWYPKACLVGPVCNGDALDIA